MKAFKKWMRLVTVFSSAMFVLLQVTPSYTSTDATSGKTGRDRVFHLDLYTSIPTSMSRSILGT
jgi:hypothetical protein